MMKNIYLFLLIKTITNISGVAIILFLSAGTLSYPTGWIFIGLLIAAACLYVFLMLRSQPDLLKKRLIYKEKNICQQIVIASSLVVCVLMLCAAGLSFRFSWWIFPVQRYFISAVIGGLGAILYHRVIKENSFLTSEITVQKEQTVIQSGPYSVIRHPMYVAMIFFLIAANLILGSVLSLAISILFIPVLVVRILNEEKILKQDLPGYIEYTEKVKYRLIPFIW